MTHVPIDPKDCAQAILFLAGPLTPCTTGHIIPVDGGLTEAFLPAKARRAMKRSLGRASSAQ